MTTLEALSSTAPRVAGHAALSAPAPVPLPTPDADANALLEAVRLQLARLACLPAAHETRAGVLECATTLERLASVLAAAGARQHSLESELVAARIALAEARIELVGIRSNERRARRQALHDELTTLPNRRFFREWLGHALVPTDRLPRDLAVFYLDLDGFKRINDQHGHSVGDELLRIVAFRLLRAVRAGDVVSRLGGDEFACALVNLPARDQLAHVAHKLFDTVSAPVKIGLHDVAVRPSIGIAVCPTDGVTVESLLGNADAAMYQAKRQGGGFAFFNQIDPHAPTHAVHGES